MQPGGRSARHRCECAWGGPGGASSTRRRLLDDPRRARTFRGLVCRGRESDHESALHELPSRDASTDAGRRSARACAFDVRRPARSRHPRIAVPVMSWNGEHPDARIVDRQHPRQSALGPRTSFNGVAGSISARDLSASEGSRTKRRSESCADPRARGDGPSCRLGVAPRRGTRPSSRHAGAVRGAHSGVDIDGCAMPGVMARRR